MNCLHAHIDMTSLHLPSSLAPGASGAATAEKGWCIPLVGCFVHKAKQVLHLAQWRALSTLACRLPELSFSSYQLKKAAPP